MCKAVKRNKGFNIAEQPEILKQPNVDLWGCELARCFYMAGVLGSVGLERCELR